MPENDKFPESPQRDLASTTAGVLLNMVPVVGGSFAEIVKFVVEGPITQRKNEWFNRLGERMSKLEVKVEDLKNNPKFIDAFLKASQLALQTSQEEKLEALKNAVINSASPASPDAATQQMFLGKIADFNEWHIRFLDLFNYPKKWFEKNKIFTPVYFAGNGHELVGKAYGKLAPGYEFSNQIWKDLVNAGFVDGKDANFNGMPVESGGVVKMDPMLTSRITDLGKNFLAFIKE